MPDRTYSERDVAAIIARAAERQRHAAPRDDAPGLTLAEIERAGQEAGLDPALLRSAAGELDAGTLGLEAARPGTAVADRWVEGPLPPGAWEDVVAALRIRLGSSAAPTWWGPDTSQVGADQEWTHTALGGVRTTVSVSPRGERTRIRVVRVDRGLPNARVQGTVVSAIGALPVGLLAGALVAGAFGWGDVAGVAALLLVLVLGTALGSMGLTRRTVDRRDRQADEVKRLAADLADRLAHGAPTGGDPQGTERGAALGRTNPAEARPDLDLSGIDAEAVESAPRQAPRRARS